MAENKTKKRSFRFKLGIFSLIFAVVCPIFSLIIPYLGFPDKVQGFLVVFFLIGAPELFLFLGAILAGKEALEFIKRLVLKWLKRESPLKPIRKKRYIIGLWLLFGSIVINWILTYLFLNINLSPGRSIELFITVFVDLITVASFIVLGGQFWEKLKRLFKYEENYMSDHFPKEYLEESLDELESEID